MKQFKRAGVVMLKTENATSLWLPFIKGMRQVLGYHLYIISDDEIKEGDWITGIEKDWGIYNEIHQVKVIRELESGQLFWFNKECNGISAIPEHCKKIIAITDILLYHSISNKELYTILPQPSQQLIKKYIESYNKGEVITDVLVEYESAHRVESSDNYNDDLIIFSDVVIKTIDKDEKYDLNQHTKLKINPKDNTITIKKLKDNLDNNYQIKE